MLEKKLIEAKEIGDSYLYSITLEDIKVKNELKKLRRLFNELGLTLRIFPRCAKGSLS